MKSKDLKGINYSGSSYSLIPYNNAGNIDVPSIVNRLLPLDYLSDTTDFFTTDIANHTITINKAGYLRVALKTTLIIPTGGELNLQVFKNSLPSVNTRRQFNSSGYVDVSFEEMVAIGDIFYIELRANMDGVALKYIAPLNNFEEQPTYVINLELVEQSTNALEGPPAEFFTNEPIDSVYTFPGVGIINYDLSTIANTRVKLILELGPEVSAEFGLNVIIDTSYNDGDYVYLNFMIHWNISISAAIDNFQNFNINIGSELVQYSQGYGELRDTFFLKGWYQVDKVNNMLLAVH